MSYANNKGADQPAHPRSLISAFVFRCLDSIMSLVSVTKLSSLLLASVAEQASLSLTWSETPEDTFSYDEAHIISNPLDCVADSSSSRRSIQFDVTLGGRYAVHSRKGFEFGDVILDQIVSKFDISNSYRRLQLILFRKYKITPPPDLSCVTNLSFRI